MRNVDEKGNPRIPGKRPAPPPSTDQWGNPISDQYTGKPTRMVPLPHVYAIILTMGTVIVSLLAALYFSIAHGPQ